MHEKLPLLKLKDFLSHIWTPNPMNFAELVEQLKGEDELTLLELLDLNSEKLVDQNLDSILDNIEKIYRHFSDG